MQRIVEVTDFDVLEYKRFDGYYHSDPPTLKSLKKYYCRVANYFPLSTYRLFWLCGEVNGLVFVQLGKITHKHLDKNLDGLEKMLPM